MSRPPPFPWSSQFCQRTNSQVLGQEKNVENARSSPVYLLSLLREASARRLTCPLFLDYSPSTIWVGIAKGLGSNEHLLDLLKHYRDEGRDAASKKEIEDWLRSHIPGASRVGGLLNESIRILSQEQGKTGKIIKNQHYFKKVKAALKYRVEFLASAGGIERVGDGDHVAAVQSAGVERGPVVIRSAKEGGLQAVGDCAELPGNLIIGTSTADSIETTAGEDCIISEVHVVVQG
jgi:hypothetical protein